MVNITLLYMLIIMSVHILIKTTYIYMKKENGDAE